MFTYILKFNHDAFIKIKADCVNQTGLENLFNSIFIERNYNPVVRPVHNESGLTIVNTELKILQLDLVIFLNLKIF